MYGGLYSGSVSNAADPGQNGRVQVIVPAVQSAATMWAAVCAPPGNRTVFQVGQSVWVMFEGGNANFPVVMGVKL